MKRPKPMPGNASRRKHSLDGFSWSGQNLHGLSYRGLARVTSSKKGVFLGTWRARRRPVTL